MELKMIYLLNAQIKENRAVPHTYSFNNFDRVNNLGLESNSDVGFQFPLSIIVINIPLQSIVSTLTIRCGDVNKPCVMRTQFEKKHLSCVSFLHPGQLRKKEKKSKNHTMYLSKGCRPWHGKQTNHRWLDGCDHSNHSNIIQKKSLLNVECYISQVCSLLSTFRIFVKDHCFLHCIFISDLDSITCYTESP